MGAKVKIACEPKKQAFPEVLAKCMGVVTTACKQLGISRNSYHKWFNEDPEFRAACEQAYEIAGDFVESKLYELIADKNPASIIFYCKTRLRSRGYVERREIETVNRDILLQNIVPMIKKYERDY